MRHSSACTAAIKLAQSFSLSSLRLSRVCVLLLKRRHLTAVGQVRAAAGAARGDARHPGHGAR
eukprot:6205699-Pleurochrysis_carterae.AAC.1